MVITGLLSTSIIRPIIKKASRIEQIKTTGLAIVENITLVELAIVETVDVGS